MTVLKHCGRRVSELSSLSSASILLRSDFILSCCGQGNTGVTLPECVAFSFNCKIPPGILHLALESSAEEMGTC